MAKICKHCGVELSPEMDKCPLCGNLPGDNKPVKDRHKTDAFSFLKRSRNLWEAFGVIALITIALTILVNFILDKTASWSLFVAGGVISVWLYYTIYQFAKHYIAIWAPAGLAVTLSNLLLIDALTGGVDWFISLALPLTTAAFLLAAGFALITKMVKYQGFNVLGFAILHIIVFCIVCEIFLKLHLYSQVELRWSIFVAASATPIAAILIFVHYRLKRGNDLKSFFHI
ncbi:MAG: DUF6320 domain-containing protein [Bacteroidales bacterium]